ncbi:MAG: SUMF1/EgtB/PvdO family nonheme iron enzyme [Chloroflexi bacterium]|nr:SUMF1/EgtB/PvdO family nonheme iron enzyme [Chloroflexota bacterium]
MTNTMRKQVVLFVTLGIVGGLALALVLPGLGIPGLIAGAVSDPATPPDLPLQRIPAGAIMLDGEEVMVAEFFIGVYEVNNANYALCVAEGECDPPLIPDLNDEPYFDDLDFAAYPVLGVDQDQATAFCTWAGMQLPTALEWQKAAGWDPMLGEMRTYPWGERFTGSEANLDSDGPQPNGTYPLGRSAYYLVDMSGNAAEWVLEGDLMGGSWASDPGAGMTTSSISSSDATESSGFRCALSYPPPGAEPGTANTPSPTPTLPPVETEELPPLQTDEPGEANTPTRTPSPTPVPEPVGDDDDETESAEMPDLVQNDPTGDVLDYNLTGPATSDGAALADLTGVSISLDGQMVPPTGGESVDEGYLRMGDGSRAPIPWGEDMSGEGEMMVVMNEGAWLWLDSPDWIVTFDDPEEGVRVTVTGTSTIVTRDMPNMPGLPPMTFELPNTVFTLGGANSLIFHDEETGDTEIDLHEGTLEMSEPASNTYTSDGRGETALSLRINPAGEISQSSITLDDLARVTPDELSALRVQLNMNEPVAEDATEAEQVWIIQLDLDGDASTGLQPPDPPQMFQDLGADLLVRVELTAAGVLEGRADFLINDVVENEQLNIRVGDMPVDVFLDETRQQLTVELSMLELQRKMRLAVNPSTSQPVPMVFSAERLRWRAAAINYTPNERPKDIYPPIDTAYPAPPDRPEVPQADQPPEVQSCTALISVEGAANLRSGPGTTFDVLDAATNGTTVTVIGANGAGDWYQVQWENDVRAWIADFLLANLTCPAGYTLPITG